MVQSVLSGLYVEVSVTQFWLFLRLTDALYMRSEVDCATFHCEATRVLGMNVRIPAGGFAWFFGSSLPFWPCLRSSMMCACIVCAIGCKTPKLLVGGEATTDSLLRATTGKVDMSSKLVSRRVNYRRRTAVRQMSDCLPRLLGEPSVELIPTTDHTWLLRCTFCDVFTCPGGLTVDATASQSSRKSQALELVPELCAIQCRCAALDLEYHRGRRVISF